MCKELMTAKESKDIRDESHSFYERDRNTERERERQKVSKSNKYCIVVV